MFERVDPFIGTEATSLPDQQGLAKTWWRPIPSTRHRRRRRPHATLSSPTTSARSGGCSSASTRSSARRPRACRRSRASRRRGGGRSRRSATRTRARRTRWAWSARARTAARTRRATAATTWAPRASRRSCTTGRWPAGSRTSSSRARARSASTTTTSASRRCCSRWTTWVQLWDVVDESAEPGYYAATLDSGHPRGDHGRPQVGRPPVHVPRAPRRAAGHRLLAGRPVDPARADGAAAGAPALDQPGDRAGRDRRRGCSAGDPRGVRRPALAAAALVRPSAHAGRHAAGLRPDPADDAAAVRADVGGAVGARSGGGAAVRVLAAGRRPGAGEPRAGVRAGSVQLCDEARGDGGGLAGGARQDPGRHRVEGQADRLLDGAVPLADQAVPGARRVARSGRRTGRSRSTSRPCGTSTGRSCRC